MRIRDDDRYWVAIYTAIVIAFFAGIFSICYVQAMQEAATYNRLTGADVTAWDALFVELRVEGSIK